jgi:signal transduction histidine kinase
MGVVLTNITHELLTPLTVIYATIYKLRSQAPQYEDEYQVIDNNIQRTKRLLTQILEVRKSQAGQLRLKVSRGDLAAFVSNVVEEIRPMAEQKHISSGDLTARKGEGRHGSTATSSTRFSTTCSPTPSNTTATTDISFSRSPSKSRKP